MMLKFHYFAYCSECEIYRPVKLTLQEKIAYTLFDDNLIIRKCQFCNCEQILEISEYNFKDEDFF